MFPRPVPSQRVAPTHSAQAAQPETTPIDLEWVVVRPEIVPPPRPLRKRLSLETRLDAATAPRRMDIDWLEDETGTDAMGGGHRPSGISLRSVAEVEQGVESSATSSQPTRFKWLLVACGLVAVLAAVWAPLERGTHWAEVGVESTLVQ